MANGSSSSVAPARQAGSKLAHALPTGSTAASIKIGHVQLRDLVHSTGPRGRVAYVTDKAVKEVDVRRGVQVNTAFPTSLLASFSPFVLFSLLLVPRFPSIRICPEKPGHSTRTLAALDFQPNCIALSPSGGLLVAGGQRAELQITTVAPPPHPSISSSSSRRRNRARGFGTAVSDERLKATKSGYVDEESDEETDSEDEEVVDESMEWSRTESEATRTRRVEVRGTRYREIASINNHVLVLGDEEVDGGVYGEGRRNPDQTRIVVSNNDEYVRVFDVDTRESAGKEWGSIDMVGAVKLGTAANHVSISPDGRTMLAVGDDTRLQIFNVNARSRMVDFEHVGAYTSGTEPNFTSAWSASGLQFAAASQDGTVTTWDVRSSRPLATWTVAPRSGYRPHPPGLLAGTLPPSSTAPNGRRSSVYNYDSRFAGAYMNTDQFMWDPSTPGPGHGIRSLRFSRSVGGEVLVFAEHTAHVHVVDARTFTEHQILDVPRAPRSGPASPVREAVGLPVSPAADCLGGPGGAGYGGMYTNGQGLNPRGEREVDLTGVTFDRSGGWMYVGTEGSVVEFEMVGGRGRTYDFAEWN
ncbi:WD40 repeat-like protein [Ceratobasidium sp. AG-I]|nr:WD40 repeat-like protein [Ceratobasidium sp. AG-I]